MAGKNTTVDGEAGVATPPAATAINVKGQPQDRVKVTAPGAGSNTTQFKGRTFKAGNGGEVFNVSDLGWTDGDVQEAKQKHGLIIEAAAPEPSKAAIDGPRDVNIGAR